MSTNLDIYSKSQTDSLLGNKADKTQFTTETWTFTLDDDTVVTKTVYLVPPSP